jgi:hypothetical protein
MIEPYEIVPSVDATQEFIEISNDFSNPLDIVREAISNAFDAKATRIEIHFDVIKLYGEKVLQIRLSDNGLGMNKDSLQSFFDLGNSLSRGNDENIGEKGHGTKVYFNSSKIVLFTTKDAQTLKATMDSPIKKLYDRIIPTVQVEAQSNTNRLDGTEIIILGYNNNRRDQFTHANLKDYIQWFTKFGSSEQYFNIHKHEDARLILKGLDVNEPETIRFGHPFPDESPSVQKLFDKYITAAPEYYCKRIIKEGSLRNHPEIKFQAIFSIEGNKVKREHNPMISRNGKTRLPEHYTVQERYGIWLSRDFIPVQRKNEWITSRGSEYIKFHAFVNCQDLKLTANRGSIDNTPSEILEDLKHEVKEIYNQIVGSTEWTEMEWLEEEVHAHKTAEKEKSDFDWRKNKITKSNIAVYKGITLVEPQRESGVFALAVQLSILNPETFPFQMLDYDTHSGIDVIAKGDKTTPITSSALYYIEFKHRLTQDFNHTFQHLYSIVCWDTELKHGDIIRDLNGQERKFEIIAPEDDKDYTHYLLNKPSSIHKIEVFVLKDYLTQKLDIHFRPRTEKDIF